MSKQPYFEWLEDEDTLAEVYLIRNSKLAGFPPLNLTSFPVSQTGYDVLSDLITVLDQMRQHIHEVLAPMDELEYNSMNVQSH